MLGKIGKLLVLLVFIAYPILLHIYILKDEVEMWCLLLVFAPLLVGVSWILFRSFAKIWWPFWILLNVALIYYVVTGEHGRVGLLALNGLSHASLNLFLLGFFGRTLLRGREPLISQIARHITGHLEPEIVIYTRQVTMAWCLFFSLQVLVSLLLYIFAPIAVWSFFINILNLPLLILMFIAEHAYRTARFPNHTRTSIMKAIEVYTRDFSAPKKANSER